MASVINFRLIQLINFERRDERSVDKIKRIIDYELRDGFEFSSMELYVCGLFQALKTDPRSCAQGIKFL